MLQVESPCRGVQGDLSRKVKNKLEAPFQCRFLQDGHQPWILSFFLSSGNTTEFYCWSAKTANLGASFWKNRHTFNVFMLEENVQNPGKFLFRFSRGGCVMERSGDGRFGGWLKIIAINHGYSIPEFWDAGRGNCIFFEQDHPEFSTSRKRSDWRKRRLRKRITYMIYDYFRVLAARDTVLDYADLFSITLRNYDVQEFDTSWDEILSFVTKIPADDILESLYKLWIRESDQLQTVLELYDMETHPKISRPDYQSLKAMVKRRIDLKLGLRNFDARSWRIETGAVVSSRRCDIERRQGVCHQWKAKGQCSGGDQSSFQHDNDGRAKSTPKTAEPPTQRGRSASRKMNLRSPIDIRAETSWKVFALNYLVTVGILPNVSFYVWIGL